MWLNTYAGIRRIKRTFEETLEGLPHGAFSSGVAKMTGTGKGMVAKSRKDYSNELLTAFHMQGLTGYRLLSRGQTANEPASRKSGL